MLASGLVYGTLGQNVDDNRDHEDRARRRKLGLMGYCNMGENTLMVSLSAGILCVALVEAKLRISNKTYHGSGASNVSRHMVKYTCWPCKYNYMASCTRSLEQYWTHSYAEYIELCLPSILCQ